MSRRLIVRLALIVTVLGAAAVVLALRPREPARAGPDASRPSAAAEPTARPEAPAPTSTPEAQGTKPAALADALWKEGVALEERGDVDAAIDRYREAIDLGPYQEDRRYRFGSRFVALRPLAEVEAYYREAVLTDPKPQTSLYFWGVALARARQLDRAVEKLREALDVDPAHEMSHQTLGDVFVALGLAEEALEAFRRAVDVHPEFRSSHERLAVLLDRLGRPEEAERHRELARTSDPNTPRRYFYWGRALMKAGRVEAALPELEKAVSTIPDDAEARALLDEARRRLDDAE